MSLWCLKFGGGALFHGTIPALDGFNFALSGERQPIKLHWLELPLYRRFSGMTFVLLKNGCRTFLKRHFQSHNAPFQSPVNPQSLRTPTRSPFCPRDRKIISCQSVHFSSTNDNDSTGLPRQQHSNLQLEKTCESSKLLFGRHLPTQIFSCILQSGFSSYKHLVSSMKSRCIPPTSRHRGGLRDQLAPSLKIYLLQSPTAEVGGLGSQQRQPALLSINPFQNYTVTK